MKDNLITNTTEFARKVWDNYINENSIGIDATVGNGLDTLYLASKCKKVIGFDIQKEAIDTTDSLLKENGFSNYELFLTSHDRMKEYVNELVDLVVFNLGYLPGGNKAITTSADLTIKAIKEALLLIKKNGLVSIMIYWGHDEGKQERTAIKQFVEELDSKKYHCLYVSSPNQKNCPPEVVFITKKESEKS